MSLCAIVNVLVFAFVEFSCGTFSEWLNNVHIGS